MTFREQILVTLLDKGLLALVIVIATFCVNIILEKYKSYRSLNNEVSKIRLVAMNNTWSKIYSWIVDSNSIISNPTLKVEETKGKVRDSVIDVIKIIEENRFLCGNIFSNECLDYCNSWAKYFINPDNVKWHDDHYKNLKSKGESIISSFSKYLRSLEKH